MKTPALTFTTYLAGLQFVVNPGFADTPSTQQVLEAENAALKTKCVEQGDCTEEDFEKIRSNQQKLDDLTEKFRFGIAIGYEAYQDEYINSTELLGDEKVVRISDSQEFRPSVWLETHYVWDGWASRKGFTHSAPGFYLGVRLLGPDSEVFSGFGLGVMWSFKRTRLGEPAPEGQLAESINVGIGPVWHTTKTLATGIMEGQLLPPPYDDVKLDDRDEVSWMIMVSAGF